MTTLEHEVCRRMGLDPSVFIATAAVAAAKTTMTPSQHLTPAEHEVCRRMGLDSSSFLAAKRTAG